MPTNLTISYWLYIAHIGIIPADSRNKIVGVKDWQKLDLDDEDFNANLPDYHPTIYNSAKSDRLLCL